jgi:hypothetical protein
MSVIQLTVQCCIQAVCCGFHFVLEFVTLTCCYSMSVIQLTVQCCIQTVCCGFQFVLHFVTFNLLLQYFCYLADSTVLYTDCVLWPSVCIKFCNI